MSLLAQSTSGDIDLVLDLVSRVGVVGLLVIIVYGGWKRWWVFNWALDAEREARELVSKERDYWRSIALRSVNLAETVNELRKEPTP